MAMSSTSLVHENRSTTGGSSGVGNSRVTDPRIGMVDSGNAFAGIRQTLSDEFKTVSGDSRADRASLFSDSAVSDTAELEPLEGMLAGRFRIRRSVTAEFADR